MATYAAYRHIELDNIGYGKKRVLKPPGGGSSDIFGGNDSANPQPERRTKNHNASNLPFGDTDSTDTASVKSDGAPSSGDESSKPKERTTSNSSNSSDNSRPVAPARARVPPGGFSSGLW